MCDDILGRLDIIMGLIKLFFINLSEPIVIAILIFNCVFLITLAVIDVKLLSKLYEVNYKELDPKMLKKFCLKVIKKISIAIVVSSIIVIFFVPVYLKNEYIYIAITFLSTFIIYLTVVCKSIEKLFVKKSRADKLSFNKNLENCLENIKEFKHNFVAVIQHIGREIEKNNFDELKSSYKDIIQEYKDTNSLCMITPESINESAVYNILCNKLIVAKQNDIQVELDIKMDFSKIKVKSYELVRILGILLDNAIEAAKDSERKCISISFLYSKNKSIIKISNTYDNKEKIDLEQIFKKGYSTKTGNTGLGLWEIRRILSKRSNLDLYTYKEKNIFNQELFIYNK